MHLAVLDIIPTLNVWERMDGESAMRAITGYSFPSSRLFQERIIRYVPSFFLHHVLNRWAGRREALDHWPLPGTKGTSKRRAWLRRRARIAARVPASTRTTIEWIGPLAGASCLVLIVQPCYSLWNSITSSQRSRSLPKRAEHSSSTITGATTKGTMQHLIRPGTYGASC
jgi:hypothetical protein